MDVYTSHWPDRTSVQNMIHWIKNTRSGNFAQYDGTPYNVSTITTPVALYSGTADVLADIKDISALNAQLQSPIPSVHIEGFAHMDFVWSDLAALQVYTTVSQQLSAFNRN
jgi:hypothetical protein